jgi:threonine dehydratase
MPAVPTPRVGLAEIEDAAERIRGVAWRTPLFPASRYDDGKVYLKLECLQRTGSFKVRGAWNRMSRVTAEELSRGFVAVSSGNHGQAVAWCAQKLGARCEVYVPDDANERKVKSIESMGAIIVRRPHHEIMESLTDDRMYKLGLTYVNPVADPYVVAGQGTVGLELLEDLPDVRSAMVPVGVGGLVNGIAFAIKAKKPDAKVFGVQAEGCAPLPKSLMTGREDVGEPKTIADGIAASMVFDYMLPLFKENLAGAFTVSDQEILVAMKHIIKECHAVAEPAGASSLAAAIKYRSELSEPIACIISGGSAPPQLPAGLLSEG